MSHVIVIIHCFRPSDTMGNIPLDIIKKKQPDLQDIFSQFLPRCVEWRPNQKSMGPLEQASKASVAGYVI